jgi:acyl homoserine lactone synthase
MMKDAALGKLDGIPADLFDPAMCRPELWEGTRLVVGEEVSSMTERVQCLALVIDGLMRIIGDQGGTSMITLSPPPLQRTAKMVGAEAHRISRTYVCDSDGREYAVFETKVARAIDRLVALGIDVETLEAGRPPLREAV